MRKKKTPEELAAEAELEDQDEFTSMCLIILLKNILNDFCNFTSNNYYYNYNYKNF